jgi:hypothetical protein
VGRTTSPFRALTIKVVNDPDEPIRRRALVARAVAALATVALVSGCGVATTAGESTISTGADAAAAEPLALHGAEARAAGAVDVLGRALRDGDVARLCRPGDVFTPSVVVELNTSGASCEASLELSSALTQPPALTVTSLSYRPGLATAQVRLGTGATIPLDLVHDGRRWLVSFSDGVDPIAALEQ